MFTSATMSVGCACVCISHLPLLSDLILQSGYQFDAGGCAVKTQERGHVKFYRPPGQEKFVRDFLVGLARQQQVENLLLARANSNCLRGVERKLQWNRSEHGAPAFDDHRDFDRHAHFDGQIHGQATGFTEITTGGSLSCTCNFKQSGCAWKYHRGRRIGWNALRPVERCCYVVARIAECDG